MGRNRLIRELLRSKDPSIRWRTRVNVQGESLSSPPVIRLQEQVRESDHVQGLLSHQLAAVQAGTNRNVYRYWQGIHWVLGSLADLGYPSGEPQLEPLVARALRMWLAPHYHRTFPAQDRADARRGGRGVAVLRGRARRCASQQGSALLYTTKLGFSDDRSEELATLLLRWQWPDGGWNCDTNPAADSSSFMETLLPMRGLAAYAKLTGQRSIRHAAERASEVFLRRNMYRRRSDGEVISPDFVKLHYPLYWHYDALGGLKGIAEVGRISDPRCAAALDWLEEKELPGGGWPAESRLYRVSSSYEHGAEYVNWGDRGRTKRNEWVTTDALHVLHAAGRLAS